MQLSIDCAKFVTFDDTRSLTKVTVRKGLQLLVESGIRIRDCLLKIIKIMFQQCGFSPLFHRRIKNYVIDILKFTVIVENYARGSLGL
jgi:hypothetical protein